MPGNPTGGRDVDYSGGDDDDASVIIEPMDVPLAGMPFTEIPEEDVPLADAPAEEELTEIPEDEVPLAEVPKTGDGSKAWLVTAIASGLGLVWMAIASQKRKDETAE